MRIIRVLLPLLAIAAAPAAQAAQRWPIPRDVIVLDRSGDYGGSLERIESELADCRTMPPVADECLILVIVAAKQAVRADSTGATTRSS